MNRKLIIKKDSVEAVDYIENPGLGGMLDDFATGELDGVVAGEAGLGLEQTMGKALSFDGVGDYVKVPNVTELKPTTALTVEFKLLQSQAQPDFAKPLHFGQNKVDPYGPYGFQYGKGTNLLAFGGSVNNTRKEVILGYQLDNNTFYHITGVYDGNTLKLYVDGVLEETLNAPGLITDYDSVNGLGIGDKFELGQPFIGIIDDVRIWNVARTQQQIQDNMNKELTGNETGLVSYWKFNEGEGTTAYDSAGSNHGTIYGATWVDTPYKEQGSRISPPLDLSSVGEVKTSEISWQTTEPDDTSVKVLTAVTEEEEVFEVSRTEEGAGFEDGVLDGVVAGEEGLELDANPEGFLGGDTTIPSWDQVMYAHKIDKTVVGLPNNPHSSYYNGNFKGAHAIPVSESDAYKTTITPGGTKKLNVEAVLKHDETYIQIFCRCGGLTTSVYVGAFKLYFNDDWSGTIQDAANQGYISPLAFRYSSAVSTSYVWDSTNIFTGGNTDTKDFPELKLFIKPLKRLTHIEFYTNREWYATHDYFAVRTSDVKYILPLDIVNWYSSGSRLSLPLDLSSLGQAVSSYIEWDATIPEDTTLTVETGISEDAETEPATWDEATSGQPIPSISANDDLTGKYLWVRQTLETEDETVTPTLHSLTVTVEGDTAIGVALDPEENDWEEQENGQLITNLPESMIGKYLWLKQVLETTDTSVTPTLHWLALNWNKTAMRLTKDALIVRGKFIEGGNEVKLDKYDFYAPEFIGLEKVPGPATLIAGTMQAGFFGEVSASELISGTDLASLVGISQGTSQHSTAGWLKFAWQGKILFVAKKAFRNSISWDHINSANAVYGDKSVVIDGLSYKIRLLKGANKDPAGTYCREICHGSEWNRLMLPIHQEAINKNWAYPDNVESDIPVWSHNLGAGNQGMYTDEDILTHYNYGSGSRSWCQEVAENVATRINRGDAGVSSSFSDASSFLNNIRGWRPCLEFYV